MNTCQESEVNVGKISENLNFSGNTTVEELMMRLMGAMEIFTAQQLEDIKDEVRVVCVSRQTRAVSTLLNPLTRNGV